MLLLFAAVGCSCWFGVRGRRREIGKEKRPRMVLLVWVLGVRVKCEEGEDGLTFGTEKYKKNASSGKAGRKLVEALAESGNMKIWE